MHSWTENTKNLEQGTHLKMCMTVQEMAKELGIGLNHAYQLVNSAGFPVIRFGERKIRIPRAALEEWLLKQAHKNNVKEEGLYA